MSKIEKLIEEKANIEITNHSEFKNILLDGLQIIEISTEDKEFLEKFTECQFLSMNQCSLKSLQNLPALPKLIRIELNDNRLFGKDLGLIPQTYKTLEVLKLANNLIKDFEYLRPLQKLGDTFKNLDLSANPVADVANYRDNLFDLLPELKVLDGIDKNNIEVFSEEDDFGEEELRKKHKKEKQEHKHEENKEEGEEEEDEEDEDEDDDYDEELDDEASQKQEEEEEYYIEDEPEEKFEGDDGIDEEDDDDEDDEEEKDEVDQDEDEDDDDDDVSGDIVGGKAGDISGGGKRNQREFDVPSAKGYEAYKRQNK